MKRKVAIVAGGDSLEWQVSLRSAAGLNSFIDNEKYEKYIVTVVGQKWQVELDENTKLPIDKNDFSFMLNGEKIKFDFAYITIHGTPGENGIIEGYFRLMNIPFSCCDVLQSALTFNKYFCVNYLKGFGINVAKSVDVLPGKKFNVDDIIEEIGLPCFVKPTADGSSFGVTKVKTKEQLVPAIELAHRKNDGVMIESLLTGTEVTCGMYKTQKVTRVFPVTEVVTGNEFFDYDAKYNGQVQEITPARISDELAERIKKTTVNIYDILQAKGLIRVDYIVDAQGGINLLEVNTTPGMTATSFIPQQIKAAGLDIKDVMTEIIENEF